MHASQNSLEFKEEKLILCFRPFFFFCGVDHTLTCPLLSNVLLVNLTLLNSMGWACQCEPVAGLSGCKYILCGDCGSAPPAGIHWEPENLKRQSPMGNISIKTQYWASSSKPLRETRIEGNIRLLNEREINKVKRNKKLNSLFI